MKIPLISALFKSKSDQAGRFAVGLGEHGAYLAKIKFTGAMPCVECCEYHEIGSVSSASLEKLRAETNVGDEAVTTLLSSGDYQLLLVEAPAVSTDELKMSIRWKIKDSLNYPIDDATVDVLQIPASNKHGADRAQSLYAVVAPNSTIQKRIELFEQAKIKLDVIDIPEMAQRNISALFEQSDQALALLVFDDNGGLLTVTSGGELCLSRRIEITAGQLLDANEALRKQSMDRVELELLRSLDYFDRHFNELSIKRVLICSPDNESLVEFLTGAVDLKVEKLDLSQVMDISAVPALAHGEFVSYAFSTLGAALRQESRAL